MTITPEQVAAATDKQLEEAEGLIHVERLRRRALAQAFSIAPELKTPFLEKLGRVDGGEFEQPLGLFDSLPEGWHTVVDGEGWVAVRPDAAGVPGESDDWERVLKEDPEPLEPFDPESGDDDDGDGLDPGEFEPTPPGNENDGEDEDDGGGPPITGGGGYITPNYPKGPEPFG